MKNVGQEHSAHKLVWVKLVNRCEQIVLSIQNSTSTQNQHLICQLLRTFYACVPRIFSQGMWPGRITFSEGIGFGRVVLQLFPSKNLHARTLSTVLFRHPAASSVCARQFVNAAINGGVHNRKLNGATLFHWRSFSSSTRGTKFQLSALPFSISPEEALDKFRDWAEVDQGLRYILSYDSVRIGAAYVPMWSFDLNIQFGNSNWKPPMFSVYQGNTLHIPGLSAYAGYSYRRTLINPVHSSSLVFLGDQTQPFGSWMLRDMVLKQSGASISVIPDAWNTTQARALNIVLEELQGIVNDAWPYDIPAPQIKTEVVKARRVFMPTFVIDYRIFGLEYRAFVSGCDKAAPVAGVSHQVFGEYNLFKTPEFHQHSRNFLTWSSGMIRLESLPFLLRLVRPVLTLFWFGLMRIWSSIPLFGVATGVLAGYRKILQPWMDARSASAEWERQREHEARMEEEEISHRDDFHDSGNARSYFYAHRHRILQHLGGTYEHEEGEYDWYRDWQKWAEQQWREQSRSQQQYQQHTGTNQGSSYQRQQRKEDKKFHWEFDESDPYSVLGIERGATKQEVSDAFRKQMLKYHPDVQPDATDSQKARLVERSKLISEAYRKIKTQMK